LKVFDVTLFFDSLRDVAMAANFWATLADLPSFGTLAFQNRMEYCDADGRVTCAVNWPTSCRNLVNFGPVTPYIMWLMYVCV